jgi:phosphomannomutase
MQAVIDGALSTGCEVFDVGILPTPVLFFAKDRLWAEGAVMVTGSHRPAGQNGFNITLGKLPTSEIDLSELWQTVENGGPFASGAGELRRQDMVEPYQSFLAARFAPVEPLRVVVDANNGTMSQIAPTTLRLLQYDLLSCNCSPQDGFGNTSPDPFLQESQARLSRSVLIHQAHLGVAYDGDGDQVLFADEQGAPITPEQTLVLFARALLRYQPGSDIVYHRSFAPYVAQEILKVGGRPIPLDAKSTRIKRIVLERGAVLGADGWGHYYFRTMGSEDALYATLVMLRIVSRYDAALEPVLADLR